MNNYQVVYEERFIRNLRRYSSLRQRIYQKIEQSLCNELKQHSHISRTYGIKGWSGEVNE